MRPLMSLVALGAFWQARWLARSLRTPQDVVRHQRRRLHAHLDWISRSYPYFRPYAAQPLAAWPFSDKASVNGNFPAFNRLGLTHDAALRIARGIDPQPAGYTVGMSTGTSGNRGCFVVSDRERFVWLGTILAKTVDDFPWRRHRVAMLHSNPSALYESATESGRLVFSFHDVTRGLNACVPALEKLQPTILVASPKALRLLAEAGTKIVPEQIMATGEVLDPLDAAIVAEAFGCSPRSLYQATEGFLGVACREGKIHLNEDFVHVELLPIDAIGGGVTPVVTDFTRRAQAMLRYCLNDVLVPCDGVCACGSPLKALERIEGRVDDVLLFAPLAGGCPVAVLPDPIRNAVLDAEPALNDFRLVQTGPSALSISLPIDVAGKAGPKLRSFFGRWAAQHGIAPLDIEIEAGIRLAFDRKLRRIERRWPLQR